MSEKAIAIGMYFVASGIYVVIGQPLPVEGSEYVVDLLTKHFAEALWRHVDLRARSDQGRAPDDRPHRPQAGGPGAAAADVRGPLCAEDGGSRGGGGAVGRGTVPTSTADGLTPSRPCAAAVSRSERRSHACRSKSLPR